VSPLDLSGLPDAAALAQSARALAEFQQPDGGIAWTTGGHVDPWDHVECAMAMLIGGQPEAALKAYEYLAKSQRADGSWPMAVVDGVVTEAGGDSNQAAYIAVGVWHYWLMTGDRGFVERMWPVVRGALDFAVDLQAPGGHIQWARGEDGEAHEHVLLTGCSSIFQSLRCGLALAELTGRPQPDWELAAGGLHHALVAHPEVFTERERWSMDWYYPVLGGALRDDAGRARLASRWDDFIVPDLGCRCVSDEPWVTGAETCELAIALHLVGQTGKAVELVQQVQFTRRDDHQYWTGWQFEAGIYWPEEFTTWTAAAVILAVDVLRGGVSEGVFRGDGLPVGLELDPATGTGWCGCEDEAVRGAQTP
jgi:hypothetical protein